MVKRMWREAALIAVFVFVAAVLTFFFHPRSPSLFELSSSGENEISLEEVPQLPGTITWIDARTEKDYNKGHVDGALLLNAENWADLMWQHREVIEGIEGTPVIVYCDGRGCMRSSEVAERLRTEMGLSPVYVLKGDWRKL